MYKKPIIALAMLGGVSCPGQENSTTEQQETSDTNTVSFKNKPLIENMYTADPSFFSG